MKVIKTYFDEAKYVEAVKSAFNDLKDNAGVVNFDNFQYACHPRTDAEMFKMATDKIKRSNYEKTAEYLYLNAVAESDGRPLLIVYNEEEGVKTIRTENCKLIQE